MGVGGVYGYDILDPAVLCTRWFSENHLTRRKSRGSYVTGLGSSACSSGDGVRERTRALILATSVPETVQHLLHQGADRVKGPRLVLS